MQHKRTDWILHVLIWISFAGICAVRGFPQNSGGKSASPLAAARVEISRGELDAAEEKLWSVLASDPNQAEALTLLSIIRGRQKRYPEAEALLRRVLQLDPKSVVAHRNLATALIAQNKPEAAIEEYAILVKLAPRDNQAKIDLAHLYLARGQFAEALSTLDAIPADSLPADAIPAKAASLLGLGRPQEAFTLASRAKPSPAVTAELAEVFLDGNAPQYALRILDGLLRTSPHPPARLYYLKGRALQATGDGSGALNSLRDALARDPKSVDALVAMAAMYASENKHAESFGLLQRAYALEPDSTRVLRPLVIEGMKAGERSTASRAAYVLADKSPDDLDDQYLAAAALLEGRDFMTASSIFEKYVMERPEDSKGFLGLGMAEFAQRHHGEARKALERALQIDPNLADAEYELAMVAEQQGATAEAFHRLERTIQLQPHHAKALASLGGQYLQVGDLEKAHAVLDQSVAVDPNNSKSQYDLALVLAKLGRTEEAKQHMERSRVLKTTEDAGKDPASVPTHP